MANIRYETVSKSFGDVVAVNDFNLEIRDKEFLTLVGPSGCGKSTTLNLTAGLENPSAGYIYIDDRLVNAVPPGERDIAMVFQSYALYPHMTVRENIGFGLKVRDVPNDEISRRVNEAAELLGIAELLDRRPRELSGGQRQRVALGRAITRNPKVFLLDEPLSNLDAKLRVQMRAELKLLFERLEGTVLYVTHDQVEAMTLSDRVVILNHGLVQQVGDPVEVYNNPANMFVAGFLGSPPINFIDCQFRFDGERTDLQMNGANITLGEARWQHTLKDAPDNQVVLGVRPEDINVTHAGAASPASDTTLPGKIAVLEHMGSFNIAYVTIGEHRIASMTDTHFEAHHGDDVLITFNEKKLHLFDPQTETRIDTQARAAGHDA